MKTAISIPDPIYKAAEKTAHRLGMSRSQLYSKAVAAFIAAEGSERVTEALDKVYSTEPSGLDPVLARIQARSIDLYLSPQDGGSCGILLLPRP